MAINIPIITEFADQGLKSAQGAFDTFKGKVAEAEGGMGKLKAGTSVAMDSIKANAGNMALAAGGAIAGFAIKAIGDFQDLALNVDEFRNKTDLTLDQSSKWMAYSKDLGIEADTIVDIFKDLGTSATDKIPLFDELGVAIALGPDGATDIEETFLRVNDAINSLEDPVAKGVYRNEIFGESWRNASELIQMGSDDIRTSLDDIKDFEVIDEDEIQKAKDLRDAQADLGTAFAELSVELGTKLIPALTTAVELFVKLYELASQFSGTKPLTPYDFLAYEDWDAAVGFIKETGGSVDEFVDSLEVANDVMLEKVPQEYFDQRTWEEGYRYMINAAEAGDDLALALIDVDDALAELKGEIDERQAWRNLQDEFDRTVEKAVEAFTEGTPEAIRDSERALDDLRLEVGEYIAEVDGIPTEKKTEFIANLENANIQDIENTLNHLARNRVSYIDVIERAREEAGTSSGMGSGRSAFSLRPASMGVTVNVQGSVISENDLIETVRTGLVKSQRNGAGLVYVNS